MIYINLIILLAGLILLVKGSDYFVKSSSSIANKRGVSEFTIGLTLVAVGTSIPELASSITASIQNAGGIVIGNVVGSNIANIALIVGCAAILSTIKTETGMLKKDGYIMLFAAVLFLVFSFNSSISRIEGIIFILFFIAYILFLFQDKTKYEEEPQFKDFITYFFRFKYITDVKQKVESGINQKPINGEQKQSVAFEGIGKDLLIILISGVAIVFGARYFIEQSIFFAQLLNLSDELIGITLVAVGTSLPELMVTLSASRKGYGSIALGNVIGSNVANIFLILGISSILLPLDINKLTLQYTAPFMIFISVLLLIFISTHWEIRKGEGLALIMLYIGFMIGLFYLI